MGTGSNVLVGLAQLWIAPANTTAPVIAGATGLVTAPTTPWVLQGFTESGVDLTVDTKINDIRVEEQSTPVTVTHEQTDVTIDVTFAEDTIANMATAYGGATVTTTAATSTSAATTVLTLSETLQTLALCFISQNPESLGRLFYVPEVIAGGKVKTSYRRAKAARMYPASFSAICALNQISLTDATAIET